MWKCLDENQNFLQNIVTGDESTTEHPTYVLIPLLTSSYHSVPNALTSIASVSLGYIYDVFYSLQVFSLKSGLTMIGLVSVAH